MKRYLTTAVGIAILMFIALSVQQTQAQVYLDFDTIRSVQSQSYTALTGGRVISADEFTLGLNPDRSPKIDRDDGYFMIPASAFPAGFKFEYNGEAVTKIYICVNGFITFSDPELTPAKQNERLFALDAGTPKNIIAPFWGDHYYGNGSAADEARKLVQSTITYKFAPDGSSLTIEWKNLNINLQNLNPIPPEIPQTYASFQVILYKSTNPLTDQGDIEFAYGLTAGSGDGTRLKDAAIGIRGEFGDFLNGLIFKGNSLLINPMHARTFTNRSTNWQPSGGTDWRIHYKAIQRYYLADSWGDGDVDLSHSAVGKHFQLPQNEFVTPEDERLIINSIVTCDTLDPAYRRMAYHGDVNHNGRYYYDVDGKRINITEKDLVYTDRINIPPYNAIAKQIRFEVTEYDAALIMHYRSAAILELPWLLDTVPNYGKVATTLANNLVIGDASRINENEYRFPLYPNGTFSGPVAFSFASNGQIVSIEKNIEYANAIVSNTADKAAFATTGNFAPQSPICYVTVKGNEVELTNVRFNDVYVPSLKASFVSANETTNAINTIVCTPNVVSNAATFTMNVATAGEYTISIFDAIGNKVASVEKTVSAGVSPVDFNTSELASGVYFVKVNGQNVTMTNKFVVSK